MLLPVEQQREKEKEKEKEKRERGRAWSWPDAPRGLYEFELRWQPARASASSGVLRFGSGTSFDVIDDAGNFRGGVIAPGMTLSVEAPYMAGALLPRVNIDKPEKVIGGATVPAMQSGIFWGYVSMIEGMIPRIADEYGKPVKVIATGGLAPLFADVIGMIDATEPDLTLIGLR